MIRVTINLEPFGKRCLRKTLGEITIANVKTKGDYAEYDVEIVYPQAGAGEMFKSDSIKGVSHYRSDGFLPLVRKVLNQLRGPK
jgi:hypothetical protein